ncbi:MAG: hypothetical protein Q7V63_08105 [Gammaproteobacteria bacterium]|nr:hypothetical protein [Gammaproteobacteria bacterium]
MAIPIIIFHQGDAPYLWFTLRQAKLSNPLSEIILLGDSSNAHYAGVKHIRIADFFQRAKQFEQHYQHFSTNSKAFELICMQRWLVIADYMKNHMEKAVFLDSDVMTYCDLTQEQQKFKQFDFTLNRQLGPQTMFINKLDGLERFCEYFVQYYAHPEKMAQLQSWYDNYRVTALKGGVCDMWFFEHYAKLYPERVGETFNVNSAIFDNTIQYDDGFEMRLGIKKIIWKHNKPYGYHLASKAWKPFNTLHFQGYTKCYIPKYASSKNLWFYLQSWPYRIQLSCGLVRRILSKVADKLKRLS